MKDTSVVLQNICRQIELSDSAKKTVEREYTTLGNLIADSNLISYEVEVKPQGSYNLGTAIKPINGSDDDFDIDLVAVIFGEVNAREAKQCIGDVIKSSSLYSTKLQSEKHRAWTIQYQDSHVDLVPAIDGKESDILVTDKLDDGTYRFLPSSPFDFRDWFQKKGREIYQYSSTLENQKRNEVEAPISYNRYTILQQVVQLLKQHRNKMFEDRDEKTKPISMVITILAAEAYLGEHDLSEALVSTVNGMRGQIKYDQDGNPHIYNPTDSNEDFADKWVEYPERKDSFFEWLDSVEFDLGTTNQVEFMQWHNTLLNIYGSGPVQIAFDLLGVQRSASQLEGNVGYGSRGVFEGEKNDKKVRPHTFWGN